MKKIISLFKRDYDGSGLVYDEVVPGAEWVVAGEGVATEKHDGTACMVRGGKLFKRYDYKKKVRDKGKPPPDGWEPCEPEPNEHTGHWPGWLPVGDGPEDKWYRDGIIPADYPDGTYELIGPKFQGNPHGHSEHLLLRHGCFQIPGAPRTFVGLKDFLSERSMEGLVWHHPDGRMVKIKTRDFGLHWPKEEA